MNVSPINHYSNRYKPNLLLLLSIAYKKLNQLPQAIEAVNQHIEV